jgi:hypothetical protein
MATYCFWTAPTLLDWLQPLEIYFECRGPHRTNIDILHGNQVHNFKVGWVILFRDLQRCCLGPIDPQVFYFYLRFI